MKGLDAVNEILLVNDFAWSLHNSNPINTPKKNMSPPEIKLLLLNLEKNEVEYLLVGGFAMAFHGHVRATNDIDLWIKNTPPNMINLRKALMDTGIPEASALRETSPLVDGVTMFNFHETNFKVNLVHNLKLFKEVDFDSCFSRAKVADFNGIKLHIINATDLLQEKIEVSRPKDINDINYLEELLKKFNIKAPPRNKENDHSQPPQSLPKKKGKGM